MNVTQSVVENGDPESQDYFLKFKGKVVGVATYTEEGKVAYCPFWTGEEEESVLFDSMEAAMEYVDSFRDDPRLQEWIEFDFTFEAVFEDGTKEEVQLSSMQ